MTEARRFTAEAFEALSRILKRERAGGPLPVPYLALTIQEAADHVAALRQAAQQARVLAGIREWLDGEVKSTDVSAISDISNARLDAKARMCRAVLAELDRLEAAPPPEPQE